MPPDALLDGEEIEVTTAGRVALTLENLNAAMKHIQRAQRLLGTPLTHSAAVDCLGRAQAAMENAHHYADRLRVAARPS